MVLRALLLRPLPPVAAAPAGARAEAEEGAGAGGSSGSAGQWAVKVFDSAQVRAERRETYRRAVQREVAVLRRLSHPGVVGYPDRGTFSNRNDTYRSGDYR